MSRIIRPNRPELTPEGKRHKFCNYCYGLPHRRPLMGCPGCNEPFGPEEIPIHTGMQSTHAPCNELESLVWEY